MRRRHPVAAVVEDPPCENGRRALDAELPVDGELRLHGLEQGLIHDGFMLSGVDGAPMEDLANVKAFAEQVRELPYPEPNSAADFAIAALLTLGANASAAEILHQGADRSDLEIALEDQPNARPPRTRSRASC